MRPSWWRRKGAPRWSNQAGQRHEDHGSGRPRWSSSRHTHRESASPHEVRIVEETLARNFVGDLSEHLIGDKASGSDELDLMLEDYGVEMIAPNRRGRHPSQDPERLVGYRRRWKVGRLFAWLQNFRRLVVRYEYYAENSLAFVHLGCLIILLRRSL